METRKVIGYLLFALAAIVCLVSNVWFIVKMPAGAEKVETLLTHALPEVVVVAGIAFIITHPTTVTNKVHLSLRQPHIKRKSYMNIDPDGYRYVSFGAMTLFITLAFAFDSFKLLGAGFLTRVHTEVAVIVLVFGCRAVTIWAEIKARLAAVRRGTPNQN